MNDQDYKGKMNTRHSVLRAKERAGLNRKRAEKMMDLARERGIGYEDCRWSLDRSFLQRHTHEDCKAIAFNGYCFIFDKETLTCVTFFLLPNYFGKKKTLYKTKKQVIDELERKYA